MPSAEAISDYVATLGEGPRWVADRLFWLDIVNRRLLANSETGEETSLDLPYMPGCVAPTEQGGLVVAWEAGFAELNPDTGEAKPIVDPESDETRTRFNDGGVDPAGRFWAGTMGYNAEANLGKLYMLKHDGEVAAKITDVTISNGIVWSPSADTMYYIDSMTRAVQAYDFDTATGEISNSRIVVQFEGEALPDGMTIDAMGNLWIALWDGYAVVCHDPATGRCLDRIELPVQRPTACAFGGQDLRTLYITTARLALSDESLRDQPLAGRLFRVEPGVQGAKLPDVILRR